MKTYLIDGAVHKCLDLSIDKKLMMQLLVESEILFIAVLDITNPDKVLKLRFTEVDDSGVFCTGWYPADIYGAEEKMKPALKIVK